MYIKIHIRRGFRQKCSIHIILLLLLLLYVQRDFRRSRDFSVEGLGNERKNFFFFILGISAL